MSKEPTQKKKLGSGDRSKGKPGRDARGVRINNYYESTRGRLKSEPGDPDTTRVLMDTFIKGVRQEIITPTGETVGRGRPPKYPTVQSLVDKFNEYMQYISDTYNNTGVELIPDTEGFCAFAGISRESFYEWERSRGPEYSDTLKALKTAIASYKKQLGMRGRIPAVVLAIDFNNNYGYVQQQKLEIKAPDLMQNIPQKEEITQKLPGGSADTSTDIIDV